MKTILRFFCIAVFCVNGLFATTIIPENKTFQTDIQVIEITDTSLSSLYANSTNYDVPTKLIYTNLTTVNGNIYIASNINLVSIEFPVLQSINGNVSFHQNYDLIEVNMPEIVSTHGHLYFHRNLALETVNMPKLETVYDYVYFYGNTSLSVLEICNIKEILPLNTMDPYYHFSNNNETIDTTQPCWGSTPPSDLVISNNTISENLNSGTLIGTFSATADDNSQLTYYFDESDTTNALGEDYDNDDFTIVGDQLISGITFDYEAKNQYLIKVYVMNQFTEKTSSEFIINILDEPNEGIEVIEITESTLSSIYYDASFTKPTKLVYTNLTEVSGNISFYNNPNLVSVEFPNLTSVEGNVSFHQNISLVNVDMPQLTTIKGHLYFHQNLVLETIELSQLETIYDYIYIHGNTSLTTLNVCNLKEILVSDSDTIPYYHITDNTIAVDSSQPCWATTPPTNLSISNNAIDENLSPGTVIGTLAATGGADSDLTFYIDMADTSNINGDEYDTDAFEIVGNQLVSKISFDFESKNQYLLKIYVRNQFGEKTSKDFSINITDVQNEQVSVIEISDTTLENISYYNISFTGPTKLIFKNLTTVNGNIFFYNTINLLEVQFPLLENVNGHVYIDKNLSLENVQMPFMATIVDYLYVSRNTKLTELNICSLAEISQSSTDFIPYYYIKNNPSLNYDSTCLTQTTIVLNYFDIIEVEPDGRLLAGTFSSDADSSYTIKYFFRDDNGEETTHEAFEIVGNKLYLTYELSYYEGQTFNLKIGAIRYGISSGSKQPNTKLVSKISTSSLNEKIEETFALTMQSLTLGVDDYNNQELVIYPNPTKDFIEIRSGSKLIDSIVLWDALGNKITNFKYANSRIDLSQLPYGVYYISLQHDKEILTKKIIKL